MKKTAKQIVRASDRAAKDFVSELGGRKTRASGSGLEKGDGRVWGRFRIETKCPPTGSYRITLLEWDKVHSAAIQSGEVALMHLKLHDVELVVLRLADFEGFGGVPAPYDLGLRKGHSISKTLWMKTGSQQLGFELLGMKAGEPIKRNFIVINRTDFIKLMEKNP